jgi:signal transduction histidine kinase
VVRWRDWSLPVKLSAVTLVPIVIALVLGVTTIANQVGRSDSYQRVDRIVALSSGIRTLTDELQRERAQTTAALLHGTVNGSPDLTVTRTAADEAVKPFNDAVGKAVELDGSVAASSKAATDQVARLGSIRDDAGAGRLSPAQAIGEYSTVISALLELDTTLVNSVSDNAIGGAPSALHDLQVAKEELALSQVLVDYGIGRGTLAPSDMNEVRTAQVRVSDRLDEFRASATPAQLQDFDATMSGSVLDSRDALVNSILGEQGTPTTLAFRQLSAKQWDDSSSAVIGRIGDISQRLGDQITAASAKLVDDSSSGAGLLAVLLFGALMLAAAVVFLITRQLLRSLRVLRNSALDVAQTQLPAAVRNIQEGHARDTDVRPVPVHVNDEIGEVARAFDAVHNQALRLAAEQAAMRTGYGSVFVNLSRRSQSLVQRQLQLIERLERDEEDADQLATLFQLDHLATRMRRNNENLMVLSGSEPTRRGGQPVTTTDVLRAAVSEIEQYQRVVVQPPPAAKIVGYAASDLMRLFAELLDNATAFSAPETSVTVATRLADDRSLLVDILDKGIGMNEAEVAEANIRLTEAASVDLATSRRMGLFVVGRLASRHRIEVVLHGGKEIVGVRATVTVPAELVMAAPAGQERTGSFPSRQPPPSASPVDASARRTRTVNGSSRTALASGFPAQAIPAPAWPSQTAAPAVNGYGGQTARPPSGLEISGTALFTPISKNDAEPTLTGPARPVTPALPPPAAEDASDAKPAENPLPSGKDLFAANDNALNDWWEQSMVYGKLTPPQPTEPSGPETTPIFDEMVPAWFRSPSPPSPASAPPSPPNPVPPSNPAQAPAAASPSNMAPSPDPSPSGPPPGATNPDSWDFASDENLRTVQAATQTPPPAFTQAGLPKRRRGEQLMPGRAFSAAAGGSDAAAARTELPMREPADVRGRLSSFQQGIARGRNANQHEASATRPESSSTVPSSTVPSSTESPDTQAANAGTAPLATSAVQPQPATPQLEKPVLPKRKAKPVPPAPPSPSAPADASHPGSTAVPAPATGSDGAADRGTADEWTFGSDASWKTVQAVTQTPPANFTSAGLPRRRRGEQLLPGSAVPPASGTGPRTDRDANDVRGRLSNFQQGIRRGRHRTAQSAEGNHETLEGE